MKSMWRGLCAFMAAVVAVNCFTVSPQLGASLKKNYRHGTRSSVLMTKESYETEEVLSVDKAALKKMRENIEAGEFSKAFVVLKRNPMMKIEMEDARTLLNNVNELIDWGKENTGAESNGMITMDYNEYEMKMTEGSTFIYKRLARQNLARGFGCLNDEWPVAPTTDVKPSVILDKTGLDMTALTPQSRALIWQLAGLLVFLGEFELGEKLGIDPLVTLIPLTLILFLADQALYKGAGFETIYQMFFPQYREKIIRHEAGHFLIAYLAGIPVRACVTNARDAQKYPEINGAAGTVFYDTKLQNEMGKEKVTRTSINRMSVVLMAGIAAEAIQYNKAEGGATDERALIQFLTTIQPPWNILRIQGQARWAALQAVLLIREHEQAYEALVDALKAGKGVGDCVAAIEANLPSELPAKQRLSERESRETRADMNAIFNYVRKCTFRAGGIEKSSTGKDETRLSLEVAMQGSGGSGAGAGAALKSDDAISSFSAATLEEAKALKESLHRSGVPDSTLTRAAGAASKGESEGEDGSSGTGTGDGVTPEALLDQFAKKISDLERRAESGELTKAIVEDAKAKDGDGSASGPGQRSWGSKGAAVGGGVWMNDLQSLKETSSVDVDASPALPPADGDGEGEDEGAGAGGAGGGGGSGDGVPGADTVIDLSDPALPFKKAVMPPPLPDFESRLAALEEAERERDEKVRGELVSMGWVVEEAPPAAVLEVAQQQELDSMLPLDSPAPVPAAAAAATGADEESEGVDRTLALLASHRGYMQKEVENQANKASARRKEVSARLREIASEAAAASGSSR